MCSPVVTTFVRARGGRRATMSNERPFRMLLLADSQTRAVTLNAGLARASSPRFEVRRVTSLAQALPAVAGEHFDVVMLDLGPSAAVGLDRVAALRKAALASTIVVLADAAPEAHVVQALRSGANDCLLARRGDRPGELALRIRYAITHRAEEQAERRFTALADQAPVGILDGGPDGAASYANERWRQLEGMGAEPVAGEEWQRRIAGEDREPVEDAWRAMLRGHSLAIEFRFAHADGSVRRVAAAGGRRPESPRAAGGYLAIAMGATALKAAGQQPRDDRARLQAIFAHAPAGLVRQERGGRIEMVNAVASRQLGRTPQELVGQNAADLLTPKVRARVRTEDELVLASGQASANEVSVPTDDGSTRELQVVSFPVRTRTAP
jgi:PAS domain S-box-containing protein